MGNGTRTNQLFAFGMAGQHYPGTAGVCLPNFFQQAGAVHIWHAHVRYNNVEFLFLQGFQGLVGAIDEFHLPDASIAPQ